MGAAAANAAAADWVTPLEGSSVRTVLVLFLMVHALLREDSIPSGREKERERCVCV